MVNKEKILAALKPIQDPDLNQSIVDLGFVTKIDINEGAIQIELCLTTPACPVKDDFKRQARELVMALEGVSSVEVEFSSKVQPKQPVEGKRSILGVDRVIAVGSGKGGVGKSTVAVNIACALKQMGAKVGMLDADIYGPSIPILMKTDQEPRSEGSRMIPGTAFGIPLISMGFLATGDQPLIWRGPMAHKAISQCLFDVDWGELDYLVVDLPPGTGDIHLTLSQSVDLQGVVIVSTPQDLGLTISRKTLQMFSKTGVPILGMIENMSAFHCSSCGSKERMFGPGMVEDASKELCIPYLGEIPFDLSLSQAEDMSIPAIIRAPKSPAAAAIKEITKKLVRELSIQNSSNQVGVA